MRRARLLLAAAAVALGGTQAATQAPKPAPAPVPPAPKIVPDCRGDGQDIVVCGRRGERSPYRLPPQPEGFDPDGPMSSVSRERHRLYEVGDGNGPVVSFGVKKNDPPRR